MPASKIPDFDEELVVPAQEVTGPRLDAAVLELDVGRDFQMVLLGPAVRQAVLAEMGTGR